MRKVFLRYKTQNELHINKLIISSKFNSNNKYGESNMRKRKKNFVMILSFLILIIAVYGLLISGCESEQKHDKMEQQTQAGQKMPDSTVIRSEGFEVASIDRNQDGNVFQCPMDYEVISDESGNCPVCKMKLEEYSIKDAQSNLNKYFDNQ